MNPKDTRARGFQSSRSKFFDKGEDEDEEEVERGGAPFPSIFKTYKPLVKVVLMIRMNLLRQHTQRTLNKTVGEAKCGSGTGCANDTTIFDTTSSSRPKAARGEEGNIHLLDGG